MEIWILVKTENAGQFNAVFENSDDLKEFFLTVLKHLQFADMQNAINNPGMLFADINKHYNKQFERLEKSLSILDFDNLVLSDYAENNKFKTIRYRL